MRTRSSYERRTLLARIAREIEVNQETLAHLISRERGKPIALSRAEVARAVATFEVGAEEAGLLAPLQLPDPGLLDLT